MKKFIRSLAVFLLFIFLFSMSAFATPNDTLTEEERNQQILILLEIRQDMLITNADNTSYLNSIEAELEELGVEFLSYEEIAEDYPEAAEAFQDQVINSPNSISPLWYNQPSTNYESWVSWFVQTTYNGTEYKVQQIVVQPTNVNSVLWSNSTEILTFNSSLALSATLLKEVAKDGTTVTDTFNHTIGNVYTQLSGLATVSVSRITYNWTNKENICFSYVAPVSNQNNPRYSHISNMHVTSVTTEMIATYKKPGETMQTNVPLRSTLNMTARHDNYTSYMRACYAYDQYTNHNASFFLVSDRIGIVELTGPQNKPVVTIVKYNLDSMQTIIDNN